MNISFEYSFDPINSAVIEGFQEKYNLTLPEDYKEFLLKNNGGKPRIRRFKTMDGKHTSSLMLLYPISEKIKPNLGNIYNEFNMKKVIPANLLVIGSDPIENKICICVSGNEKGSIYYWSLDMEDIDEETYVPSYRCMSLIARSFTDFINSLYMLAE